MKKFICKTCGFVTENKGEKHPCARVEAIIHNHDENPEPRSGVDALVRKIIFHLKNELNLWIKNNPDEVNKIHPRMLVNIILTNILLNLFMDAWDINAPMKETRESFSACLEDVCEMSMNGLNALLAAQADTKTMN